MGLIKFFGKQALKRFKNSVDELNQALNEIDMDNVEARFNELDNVEVVVANELIPKRANLYQQLYPQSHMICGDILDDNTFTQIYNESKNF